MNRAKQRDWVFKIIFENQIKNIDDIDQAIINHDLDLKRDSFLFQSLKSYIENFKNIESIVIDQIGVSC